MKRCPPVSLLLFLCLALTLPCAADVSLRNGNFFVSFRDISFSGGYGMKIERIYNSKSDFSGWFGYGWGSEYETSLKVCGDGSILIAEFGGGANNFFYPESFSKDSIPHEADALAAAAAQRGDLTGTAKLGEFRSKLLSDAEFRQNQWDKYLKLGLVKAVSLPVGTRLMSHNFQNQYIDALQTGYKITKTETGEATYFDLDGRVTQLVNNKGNYLRFSYDIPRQIAIRDDQGRTMLMTLDEKNHVTRIDGNNGKYAQFRYDKNGMLIYCKDDGGIENTYGYTDDQFLNLNLIGYPQDGNKTMQITYWPANLNSSVKSVTNPDGTMDTYEYVMDPKQKDYYAVTLQIFAAPNQEGQRGLVSKSKYEYFSSSTPQGMSLVTKMIVTENGRRTVSVYNDMGFPTRVEKPEGVYEYSYDDATRQTQRKTPHLVVQTSYDGTSQRIGGQQYTSLINGQKSSFDFTYDRTGLLTSASRDGQQFKIKRDSLNRINDLSTAKGDTLHLSYNANNQVIGAELKPGDQSSTPGGKIVIHYGDNGGISEVTSDAGSVTARLIAGRLADWLAVVQASDLSCEAYESNEPAFPTPPSQDANATNSTLLKNALEALKMVR